MDTVRSSDNTPIGYSQTGTGLPLVLVHGTGGSAARWQAITPALAEHFTVYAIDRRGRGKSGDAPTYSMEREFDDIAAVVNSISEPANLLGHSFGALCSLEAATLTTNLGRLILYEPPIPIPGVPLFPDGIIERLQGLLDAGDRESVVTTFMRDVVRMPADELEIFKSSPAFPSRVAAAHTLPRELRDHMHYRFTPERFRGIITPTLLMLGGDSPPFFKAAIDALASTLPSNRVVILPGQQHIAMDVAPDLFVRQVLEFLVR
jgi:pimeloyl-ACP methyl ester carboxylesterase